jgi:hypothetical protein
MHATKTQPGWFRGAVVDGLSALYVLRLEGTPSEHLIDKTRDVWCVALWTGRDWHEQRDAARLQIAFARLAAQCDRWPTPRMLIDRLPDPTPTNKRLPAPSAEDKRAGLEGVRRMREIIEAAGGGPRAMPLLPGERRRQPWER